MCSRFLSLLNASALLGHVKEARRDSATERRFTTPQRQVYWQWCLAAQLAQIFAVTGLEGSPDKLHFEQIYY